MSARPVPTPPRATKRCWDCQDRKIACDKTLPGCLKCQKRRTPCRGYGLRLSWPNGNDPRRQSVRGDHFFLEDAENNKNHAFFVHASVADMHVLLGRPAYFDHPSSFPRVPASLASIDPTLSYYNGNGCRSDVPALFASATDAFDDLYGLLVRMSLTDDGPSALATRHALSALAFQSVGGGVHYQQTAHHHRVMATRALQAAVDARSLPPGQAFQAMAASMLLNYYETAGAAHGGGGGGSPVRSAIFFCGCKRIALTMHREHTDYEGDAALLLDWILYHDTLYKFSIHHWTQRVAQQQMVGDGPKIVSKPVFSPLRHVVNPSIGCSLELLDVLCQIVDLIPDEAAINKATPALSENATTTTEIELTAIPERALRRLELRLENIKQHVTVVSETSDAILADSKKDRLETEARLYKLAAQLYLYRLGRGVDKDNSTVQTILDEAYALLKGLGSCRRPWVLFVVGVEARDEAERHVIMACMGDQTTLPKNMVLVMRLIQAAWTQIDLLSLDTAAKSISLVKVYNAVISANEFPPLFT